MKPPDWEQLPLGDIATISAGGTPSRAVREYWNGDIPWVTTAELQSGIILGTQEHISAAGLANSPATLLPPGTLLLALYGQGKTRGRVARLGITAATNQACASIVVSPSVSASFVFHALASQYNAIRKMSNTGSQENLTGAIVRSIRIGLPHDRTEQDAIAGVLDDADRYIWTLDLLIAKKRAIKQGAMQALLTGRTRLPDFAGTWREKSLGDLFSFSGGFSASREDLSANGYCYLHYGDIHRSVKPFVSVEADFESIPKLDISLSRLPSACFLRDGDVVFVDASEDVEGTSRHVVVVNPRGVPFIAGLHTIVAKARDASLDVRFRRYCFQAEAIRAQFRFFAVGTKVSGVSKTNIARVSMRFPPIREQAAIAEVLADMERELAGLEAELEKVRLVRQGESQALLTGRIRLPVARAEVPPLDLVQST